MTTVQAFLDVEHPPDVTFAVMIDLDGVTEWASVTIDRVAVPDGALHESDRFPLTLTLGHALTLSCQVVELRWPHRIAYRATSDDVTAALTQHVAPAPAGCHVTWTLEYDTDPPADHAAKHSAQERLTTALHALAGAVAARVQG